ncbi:ATP-binding protein [Lachnoclostridium sp. An14]|uniref:sensor histidine kinase n=1 Tax=Lachnoclostridium sp. An14 TaxID=1965562 RepID=UPI000B375DEE|nr:ATP-binding protein [Lachnoclostridium sp. An14]
MMTEISLNILDVAENSTRAGASLVTITVSADTAADRLTVIIDDDGCGMTEEQVAHVTDPFFTTRTTRKVGLGVPFFKYAAESTGGSFTIQSQPGVGTTVTAVFVLSHIDRMPLGDISSTIHTLVVYHPDTDFRYIYEYDGKSFTLDTREFREILGDVPFDTPEISSYIMEYLTENKLETDGGASL